MSVILHRQVYRDVPITISVDEDARSPRMTHENLGTIVYWHRTRQLGDIDGAKMFDGPNSVANFFWTLAKTFLTGDREAYTYDKVLALVARRYVEHMVYAYDHSGLALALTPFSCPWDSAKLGHIYCSLDAARKFFPRLRGAKLREATKKQFEHELEMFEHWLNGRVYCYEITFPKDVTASQGEYYESTMCTDPAEWSVLAAAREAVDEYWEGQRR